jgi:hypothetical protein
MIKELLLSVVSGVIVAVILQMFGGGNGRRDAAPRQSMRNYNVAAPRPRRSLFGRFIRLVIAVGGGIALAQIAAPFILRRRYRDFDGGYDRFDGFDGIDSIAPYLPMIGLTVIGTILVYMILSAMTRR